MLRLSSSASPRDSPCRSLLKVRDDAERIFKELADGGTVRMPLQETFWAKRFGMLIDRFGTPWMVNRAAGIIAPGQILILGRGKRKSGK
jgi:uncharacterized glyoxalase superfamily protein PhnB